MSVMGIKNLTFKYDDQEDLIFDNVNLNLDSSWHLGLIGRNGRGKTTFLNILRGNLTCNGEINSQQSFSYYPYHINECDRSDYTIYALQNIKSFDQWRLEKELNLMGVDLNLLWKPFESLSGGEKAKILLALCFIDDAFPLLDEPTNHLDVNGRKQVANYLSQKKGFILVSHDSLILNSVCDHILSIENQNVYLYHGNYRVFKTEKERRDEKQLKSNAQVKKEISTLEISLNQKRQWGNKKESEKGSKRKDNSKVDKGFIGARSARTMKKVNNIQKGIDRKIHDKKELLNDVEFIDKLDLNFNPTRKNELLTLQDFTLFFDNKKLFNNISFKVTKSDRIALIGENGVGKTSLINAILGDFDGEMAGQLKKASNIKVSVVHQEFSYTGSLKDFANCNKLNYNDFLNSLHKLGIKRRLFDKKIENMSQGQQKRVELAKSLTEDAELYIWDEPLNYLDVYNKEQLKNLILAVKPTMIIIDHDTEFIDEIANRKVKLFNHNK